MRMNPSLCLPPVLCRRNLCSALRAALFSSASLSLSASKASYAAYSAAYDWYPSSDSSESVACCMPPTRIHLGDRFNTPKHQRASSTACATGISRSSRHAPYKAARHSDAEHTQNSRQFAMTSMFGDRSHMCPTPRK